MCSSIQHAGPAESGLPSQHLHEDGVHLTEQAMAVYARNVRSSIIHNAEVGRRALMTVPELAGLLSVWPAH